MAEIFEPPISLRKKLAQTYISAKNLYSFGDFDNDDDPEYFLNFKVVNFEQRQQRQCDHRSVPDAGPTLPRVRRRLTHERRTL